MIDLHAHTTASDGTFSPTELVAHARDIGLAAVGVTDHDTLAGWDEAFGAGRELGVEIVPGVEFSVADDSGRFHLLGYYVDPQSPIIETLAVIQAARANRNGEILDNLRDLGVPLEEAEVRALAGENGQVGRPHFARAMIDRGYVATIQEAFDKYLADGKPAYATKAVLTPRDAIAGIHQAGGVAIWAHPPLNRKDLSWDEYETILRQFVDWGLDGLEVFYSKYDAEAIDWTSRMAAKYALLGTGGSDFHGAAKPDVRLGVTHTGGALPNEILTQLKARAKVL